MGASNSKNHGKSGNSRINKLIECPNCLKSFPQTTTYQIFNMHLQYCLLNKSHETSQKTVIEPIVVNEFVYEKVPVNAENIEFRWEKKPLISINNQIVKLSNQLAAKLSFQQKLIWFRHHLQKLRIPWQNGSDTLHIQKDNVLMTSFASVQKVNLYKEIKIDFQGQKVNDAGGLLREWMHLALKEIFDQSTGIFVVANTVDIMYKIRADKDLDVQFAENLLMLFGIILGKALFERISLNCYLDRTIIRQLCLQHVVLTDIYGYDKELYKNWKFLKENHIEPFGQYFSIYQETGEQFQLIEGGGEIEVDDSNKELFILLAIQYYCVKKVEVFIAALKKGFHKVIPPNLISIFQPHEFQMLLYGLPFINVDDWYNNTEYKGVYSKNHNVIIWFWKIVRALDQDKLARLLHFCTGSTRTPIFGFKKLESNRGNYAKFLIESVPLSKINPYPKGHTCFNRLQLPIYTNQKMTNEYLLAIVNNDLDGVYGLD